MESRGMRSEWKTGPIAQLCACALVAAAGALISAKQADADGHDYVTVCEVTADSERFVLKSVWIRDAMVQSNATDITTLQDARCPGIRHVVNVLITNDPKKQLELKEFISLTSAVDSYGTYGKEIRGSFYGKIQMSGIFNVRIPAIVVEKIENLSVKRRVEPK